VITACELWSFSVCFYCANFPALQRVHPLHQNSVVWGNFLVKNCSVLSGIMTPLEEKFLLDQKSAVTVRNTEPAFTLLAKPSSNLLQRTGGDHRGCRAQLGWRTFMMTCLRWILGYTRLEIWRKIGLSGDWCLCTRSAACYCWIGLEPLKGVWSHTLADLNCLNIDVLADIDFRHKLRFAQVPIVA